uniref:SBP-type domain-containing protein n=1 Tax=Fagus sylvatica TaxID=28930 RepID=A0A2N9ETS0_FAGSY
MEPPRVISRQEETGMEVHPAVTEEDPCSSLWDFGDLLDFTIDGHFSLSLDTDQLPSPPSPPPLPPTITMTTTEVLEFSQEDQDQDQDPSPGKIRKRDPRLTCTNYLAGRIPCACPEMDEKLEMEGSLRGKKRPRTVRASSRTARCQVPECEADISELKGYHRRHRVCLRCANATAVLLDGETKRYCQQCGKFHILSDFDEGKRSCRRKLERHNNRRRRKPADSGVADDKEPQGVTQIEDGPCDDEVGKDGLCLSSPIAETEAFLESEDGQVTTSAPDSQNIHGDASFTASGETQTDGGKDNSKCSLSLLYDNKNAYSSMCPTGRISFKLYDWNPAEFPRRLRHQIFQWLANMPVELEGYIRPGCTILTVFIAMPKFMWVKLFEDPASHLHDFLVAPGRMLSGRGTILVFINDMIFRVMKGGTSVMKLKVEAQAPRLHYVHPICFEAGKPMEFVACGSNLLQSKFRFLVSFAGKYLAHDYCVTSLHGQNKGDTASNFNHQLYKIHVPQTEPDLCGPAFVEVENESGLSNFIPILIGDKEICAEMKILQQRFDAAIGRMSDSCEVSALRQSKFSEFLLDVAWLLKEPASEKFQQFITASQIQRFNSLLSFLICNDSTTILEKLLQKLKILISNMEFNSMVNGTYDADLSLLQKYMDNARDILRKKHKKSESSMQSGSVPNGDCFSQSCFQDNVISVPINRKDMEIIANDKLAVETCSASTCTSETVPLLNKEVVMNVNPIKEWPRKSCGRFVSGTIFSSRPSFFVIGFAAVCLGMCAVLLHPHKVSEFAVSIRSKKRCSKLSCECAQSDGSLISEF